MTQDSDTPSENEIELWDDETEPSEEDIEIFTAAGEKLRERCEGSDVEFSVDDYGGEFDQSFVLQFPSGRDSRSVSIDDVDDANLFRANEFEDINFIKPYNAYCSYEKGIIFAID